MPTSAFEINGWLKLIYLSIPPMEPENKRAKIPLKELDKGIKDRTIRMATKRKTYTFRNGNVIEVEEFHDGRNGAPGEKRQLKKKKTKEQMLIINQHNKEKRCRHKLLQYFDQGDLFATWTYAQEKRPEDMEHALIDFQKAMRKVRKEYQKRGKPLYWIRNIEQGTRGAWHVHLVINEIGDTASIIQKAWEHGGTWSERIRFSKFHDEDFHKLSCYLTKDEKVVEKKKNGEKADSRIRQASYSTSRNMPIPEPKQDRLVRWKKAPKPKKGYYMAKIHEGINPVTGFKYRRYTMIRLQKWRN